MILAYVKFPEGAKVGEVPANVLTDFAWAEPAIVMTLQLCALALTLAYPITKTMHEANLRRLAEQRGGLLPGGPEID